MSDILIFKQSWDNAIPQPVPKTTPTKNHKTKLNPNPNLQEVAPCTESYTVCFLTHLSSTLTFLSHLVATPCLSLSLCYTHQLQ